MNGACTAHIIGCYECCLYRIMLVFSGIRRYFELGGLISEGEYILGRPYINASEVE